MSVAGWRGPAAVVALLVAAEARPIFDGKSLGGWSGAADCWRVEDSAITGETPAGQKLGDYGFLRWDGAVRDFELTLEYRIEGDPSANSGIQFRSAWLPNGQRKVRSMALPQQCPRVFPSR